MKRIAAFVSVTICVTTLAQPTIVGDPPAAPAAQPAAAPITPPPADSAENLAGSLEAKSTFNAMIAAVRDARTLVFHSRTTNTGSLAGHTYDTDANVRMRRLPDRAGAWQLRVVGSGTRAGDAQPTAIDVTWGPTGASWLDHAKQTLHERPVAQSTGPLVKIALDCVPTQLIEKSPFTKEVNALLVTLDATEPIDGVECRVLTFKPKRGSSTTRVWVGTDNLPRKIERSSELKSYANTTTVEFSDLRSGEPLADGDFTVELPEGYEREVAWSAQRTTPRPSPAPTAAVTSAASDAAPSHSVRETPRPAPPPAPAFDLATPSGDRVTLAKLKGNIVVLYFWGTWSVPGRAGIDELQKVQEEHADAKVRILAVAVRERSKDAPAEFFRSGSRTLTLLLDGEKTAADYGVSVYPTFVVLNSRGVKVGMIEGFKKNSTPEDIRTLITNAETVTVSEVEEEMPEEGV